MLHFSAKRRCGSKVSCLLRRCQRRGRMLTAIAILNQASVALCSEGQNAVLGVLGPAHSSRAHSHPPPAAAPRATLQIRASSGPGSNIHASTLRLQGTSPSSGTRKYAALYCAALRLCRCARRAGAEEVAAAAAGQHGRSPHANTRWKRGHVQRQPQPYQRELPGRSGKRRCCRQ